MTAVMYITTLCKANFKYFTILYNSYDSLQSIHFDNNYQKDTFFGPVALITEKTGGSPSPFGLGLF